MPSIGSAWPVERVVFVVSLLPLGWFFFRAIPRGERVQALLAIPKALLAILLFIAWVLFWPDFSCGTHVPLTDPPAYEDTY